MITDDQIEAALDYLRDSVDAIGTAKERLVKAGHMVKHVKALQMKKWNEQTVAAQEREAVASQPYLDAITEEAIAAAVKAANAEIDALVASYHSRHRTVKQNLKASIAHEDMLAQAQEAP